MWWDDMFSITNCRNPAVSTEAEVVTRGYRRDFHFWLTTSIGFFSLFQSF